MTSPSRRKRPTTPPGRSRPTRRPSRAAALAILAALLPAGHASAEAPAPDPANWKAKVPASTFSSDWGTGGTQRPAPGGSPFLGVPATPRRALGPIQPVFFQKDAVPGKVGEEGTRQSYIQLVPPGLERLSRLDNDEKLRWRITQEALRANPNDRVTFPPDPILSRETYRGRGPLWPHRDLVVEPNFVCYERLFFEQKNAERYGWDLGVIHPFLSAGEFVFDVVTLPYHCATDPCRKYECNPGYCLPGDPVPLMLYPPELSLTGSLAEAAVILALVAIFP